MRKGNSGCFVINQVSDKPYIYKANKVKLKWKIRITIHFSVKIFIVLFCWEDLKHGCYQLKATYLDLHSKVYKNQLTVHFLIALISHLKISNMTAVFFIILASYFRSEIPNSLNSQYACCQLIEKTNFHRYIQ